MLRRLRHALEAAGLFLLWAIFAALPIERVSALGGWLARNLGPRFRVHRRAEANLRLALPELNDAQVAAALDAMWDNLGRTFAEYPHLQSIDCWHGNRVEIVGAEIVERMRNDGRAGIFISAHAGNWEINALAVRQRIDNLTVVYRAANNPFADRMILRARGAVGSEGVNKGAEGAREMLRRVKAGGHLGLLADQKMNDGVAVPFFGRPAMTAPAWAKIALRADIPIATCFVERLPGPRFRVNFSALEIERSGDRDKDERTLLLAYHARLEDFIRAHPGQWFWVHRRWPD
jgi:KDO2-lipid IV(A) lauroyltransferase